MNYLMGLSHHEYLKMTQYFVPYIVTTLLSSLLVVSGIQGEAKGQVAVQPPEQATQPKTPEETAEEKEKAKKKKQQEEQKRKEQAAKERQQESEQKPPQPTQQQEQARQKQLQAQQEKQREQAQAEMKPQQQRPTPQQEQERQRQVQLQKQQEQQLQQKRQQEQRQLQQKRVSQQEQQARIKRQEQQLALYRQNIALREELAERDAQVLRQQKRIQHLRFQEQYEDRLRAQRAQMNQARYDYYNDPFYYTAPNYRYRRGDRYYQTNQYGMKKLEQALQAGYNEGFKAGRADREDRWRYDYRSAFAYRDANYGYDGRYIGQDEYNHYFREGFQRGYDDGYYGRQKYGRKNDDGGINDEWLIAGAVVAAIIGYQVLTD